MIENNSLGLTDGRCLFIRLKARPPGTDWPVPYPNICEMGTERCPPRKINDVENFLLHAINEQPPPLLTALRQVDMHEEENEEEHRKVYPAVWVPPQVLGLPLENIHFNVLHSKI